MLRAYRSVFVKYVESGRIYARENVEAESLIACRVFCDRDVIVRSGRGPVAGGEIHAGHDVSARTVGTPSELLTSVFLGGRPFEEFERADLERSVGELERELEKLERQPESPMKLQRMSKTRVQIAAGKMKQRQLEKEIAQRDRERAAGKAPPHGRLRCDVLNPGVEISIGSAFLRVAHETQMCTTSLSKGEIRLICV